MRHDTTTPATGKTSDDTAIAESLAFFESLFVAGDTVLVRPVETWTADNRKHSRVDFKGVRYGNVAETDAAETSQKTLSSIKAVADRAAREATNTFFGVCPRFGGGGKFDKAWQIRTVRALWADIDHVTVDEALQRVESAGLPRPSIIVSSGNGAHLYWILDTPYLIDDDGDPPAVESEWIEIHGKKKRIEYFIKADGERVNLHDPNTGKPLKRNEPELSPKAVYIQDVLQGLAAAIKGDHTFDLSRLLRVPGTMNRKDQRNGKEPKPCAMVEKNGQRHSIDVFGRFAESSPGRKQREKIESVPLPSRKRMTGKRQDQLAGLVWACGNAPAGERSEVDYRLCCWSIEHGLTSAEVWPQVSAVGKFAERGEAYFLRTWGKAENQTRCKIVARAERASGVVSKPESAGDAESSGSDGGRVDILLTTREYEINNEVIDSLRADDSLYQRGGMLVTVIKGSTPDELVQRPDDAPRIASLELATVRELISKHVNFYTEKETEDGTVTIDQHVPDWCPRAIHARGEWRGIRPLLGIVNHPVLKPDGTILTQGGYDPATGLILHWVGDPLAVPAEPTKHDAIAAVGRLKTLVDDFPFETPAHRAGWLAFVLTTLIRYAFRHAITSPLFLIDANIRGSGKSMLADLVGMIICWFALPRMVLPRDDDEMRKRMLAIGLSGDELILLDNVSGELGGPTLDAVLTGTVFKDRLLGESKDVSVAINTTFVATSNNASITGDLCRRTIHIRLSSPLENPEERSGFQIPNLLQHVRAHRNELLVDALTILRAYCVAGKPDMKLSPMGSFEDWSAMVRGPLVWLGESDPWETRIEFARQADTGGLVLSDLFDVWHEIDPDSKGVTSAEIIHLLQPAAAGPLTFAQQVAESQRLQSVASFRAMIHDLCGCKTSALPSSKTIGKRLGSLRDRVHQGKKLVSRDNGHGSMVWSVVSSDNIHPGLLVSSGFIPATSRGKETIKNGCTCIDTPLMVCVYCVGAGETRINPANPDDVCSTVAVAPAVPDAGRPYNVRPGAPKYPPQWNKQTEEGAA